MTHHFISHVNPKLSHYHFENGATSFRVFPHLGGSLLEWIHDETHILSPFPISDEGYDHYKAFYASSILFPFPNRLKDGKFSHEGHRYDLPMNEVSHANAIHGCVSNRTFTVSEVSDTSISLEYEHTLNTDFPFAFSLQVGYKFSLKGMSVTFRATNLDPKSFPFGLGWHPYFNLKDDTESILFFKSNTTYVTDAKMIPKEAQDVSIQSLPLKDALLDTAFHLDHPEVILKTKEYQLKMQTPGFDFLQLFIPEDRKSIAIEPMTCVANAFNNGIGKMILKPETSNECTVELSLL
ncbi:MAG: aldose 1-epimerase family protein [Aureisphaera sp.]